MTSLLAHPTITLNASATTTAWINAFLAAGQSEDRPVLYRTLSVEFFKEGVHFVACDGALLFRTWVPKVDADWPEDYEHPEHCVVVMDGEHFALGFVRTLLSATKDFEVAEIALSIEPAPEAEGEVPLGAELSKDVLTLRALGQQLHCRLYEAPYADWRNLKFGLEQGERVDGMKVATRMFAALGKLKNIGAIDCTFTGGEKQIILTGERNFRGLMMPMQRPKKDAPPPADEEDEQTDALDNMKATVTFGGKTYPASKANMRHAAEHIIANARDRAARNDE